MSAGNLVLTSTNGTPGPPPAPPGVVVAIDHVKGVTPAPDLLTDPRIFGYDPVTGQVLRFQLNLPAETGVVDTSFAPIAVAGSPADVGVAIGRDNERLVLLVDTGTTVSVYDATYGTSLGSFSVPAGFSSIGSTDAETVIGSTTANQLQMLDVNASLAAGTVVGAGRRPHALHACRPGSRCWGASPACRRRTRSIRRSPRRSTRCNRSKTSSAS